MATKKSKPSAKASVKKRTINPSGRVQTGGGAPFSHQDPKRRLGNFEHAGEHARVGGRGTGIVGQTKASFTTNKRSRGSKGPE